MNEREAIARCYHDWRTSRHREAATRWLWRSHCIRLVAVPVSIGLPTLVYAAGTSSFGTRRLYSGAKLRYRLLTHRITKEIFDAAGELARFPAPFFGVLSDLLVACDDTHGIHSPAPGVATGVGRWGRWGHRAGNPVLNPEDAAFIDRAVFELLAR